MNKVLNINLGGHPFTIDETAYDVLERYLDTLRRHFDASPGSSEILSDIESRLAELFQEQLGSRAIVTHSIVDSAMAAMGRPEDFGAEPMSEEAPNRNNASNKQSDYRTGKRLMRDPNDEVVFGVCSGVSAYFGIEDPVWVRAGFVFAVFTFGFGIPLYIVLSVILPKAETSADRLAMKGKPINVDNIAQVIEEKAEYIAEKATKFGEKIEQKFDGKSKAYGQRFSGETNQFTAGQEQQGQYKYSHREHFRHNSRFGNVATGLIETIGRLFGGILKAIVTIVKSVGWLFFGLLGAALGLLWFVFVVVGFKFMPGLHYITGSNFLSGLGYVNGFFLLGIPLATLVLMLSTKLFRTPVNRLWYVGLFSFWIVNLFSAGSVAGNVVDQFDGESTITSDIDIQPTADTIVIGLLASENGTGDTDFNDMSDFINQDTLRITRVNVSVFPAEGPNWSMKRSAFSRGDTDSEAATHAHNVRHIFQSTGKELRFSKFIELNGGEQFRAQRLNYDLYIPVGKIVKFEPDFQDVVSEINQVDYRYFDIRGQRFARTWRMEANGMRCLDCTGEANYHNWEDPNYNENRNENEDQDQSNDVADPVVTPERDSM
jgi:phage shock protein PspC (stress-responsive transcriptional regulator)